MLRKYMQKHSSLFETLSKYLLAAVLIIVPLFPKFPLIRITGTYVAIRFEDLLLLILAILLTIKVIPNIKDFLKNKIVMGFTLFFLVSATSIFSAAFVTQTIDIKIGLLHLFRRIEYIIPFLAVITLLNKQKVSENLNFYIKIIAIVTVCAFIYGWGQRYYNFPIIVTQNEEYSKGIALFWTPGSHINSTFAGHYDLASVMVMFLPIIITLMFLSKDNISRVLFLVSGSAGIWLLINSVSRIAQLSYIMSVAISLFLVKKFKALGFVVVISLALILTSSNLLTRFSRIFEVLLNKVESQFTVSAADVILPEKRENIPPPSPSEIPVFEDRSTSIRLNVEWPRAIRAFSKNPILGTGYSSIGLATDNDYLRVLGETGILGFTSFLLVFVRIGEALIKFIKSKASRLEYGFYAAVMGGTIGTFLTAFFIDVFEASKFAILFWFLIGLAVYTVQNTKYVQNK